MVSVSRFLFPIDLIALKFGWERSAQRKYWGITAEFCAIPEARWLCF